MKHGNLGSNKIEDRDANIIAEENYTEELGLHQNRIERKGFFNYVPVKTLKICPHSIIKSILKKWTLYLQNDSLVKVSLRHNEVDDFNLKVL